VKRNGDSMKYDVLIVGAGLTGAVMARELSERGEKCLVIDRRKHVGGNCYSELRKGIDVHLYGPHIFHCVDERIWDYFNKYCKLRPFHYTAKVKHKGSLYSFPINLFTLYQVYGTDDVSELKHLIERDCVKIDNPSNLEEWCLSTIGHRLYNIFVYGYTTKQWGVSPRLLPKSIIKRIPVRYSFDDNYYPDDHISGIPEEGYYKFFEAILDSKNIDVVLGEDGNKEVLSGRYPTVVYTGSLDELFGYCFGELQYRSLNIDIIEYQEDYYQGGPAVHYTDLEVRHTRIVEYKHFVKPMCRVPDYTVISKETPVEWRQGLERFYPLSTEENKEKHARYLELAKKKGILPAGRLGRYQYLDMHQAIGSALSLCRGL